MDEVGGGAGEVNLGPREAAFMALDGPGEPEFKAERYFGVSGREISVDEMTES